MKTYIAWTIFILLLMPDHLATPQPAEVKQEMWKMNDLKAWSILQPTPTG